jgi:hypothetical protein
MDEAIYKKGKESRNVPRCGEKILIMSMAENLEWGCW